MKNHNKKRALFSSIISLILCVTMLLGTTFAWFTSSVSNTGNRIRTGELGVALYKYDAEAGDYKDISDGTGDIFTDSGENGTLWEPNRTEIVFLEVRNTKSLALNYNLILDVIADTANGAKLQDVLSYAILPGVTGDAFDWNQFTCWDDVLKAASGVETGVVPAGQTTAAPNGALKAGESDFFALAVHMDKEAGNEYQDCDITIDVQVMARQMASEYDSFGNQYDADSLFTEQTPIVLEDILKGTGDMEEANQSVWVYRSATADCHGKFEFLSDDGSYDGSTYLKLTSASTCQMDGCTKDHKGKTQSTDVEYDGFSNVIKLEPGKKYILKAMVKQEDNTQPTAIRLVYRSSSVGKDANFQCTVKNKEAGVWEEVSYEFETPSDAVQSKYKLQIWGLLSAEIGNSVSLDNIRIYPTEPPSETAVAKMDFLEQLAKEDAESMMPVYEYPEPTIKLPPVEGTESNLLLNGSFNTDTENWEPNSKSKDMYEWCQDEDGNGYLKIENTSTLIPPAIGQAVHGLVPSAEYQISFKYKIDPSNTVTTPYIEMECYSDVIEPGYESKGGHIAGLNLKFDASEFIRDGEWHEYSYRSKMLLMTDWVQVFLRHTRNSTVGTDAYVSGAVCYDDVTFTMTNTGNPLEVDSQVKICYSDMDSTTFTANVDDYYKDKCENGSVVFEVFDGQNSVYKSESIALSDGTAQMQFDLGILKKINVPYCVRAILYVDGKEVAVAGTEIFMFDRPASIDENGEYVKFGEDFIPVFGYHVTEEEDLPRLAEAGINVVQRHLNGLAIDNALETLDKYDELGLKVMACLYFSVDGETQAAGHEGNMEKTIALVSNEEVRNHPALFGYCVVDEPWSHSTDPTAVLENSYRLIRQYDKDNVIMYCENNEGMAGLSSHYADVLIMDPYHYAAGAGVYKDITRVMSALPNKKPVMSVLQTFIKYDFSFNTPDDVRNNNYQALMAGVDGLGYYSISDAGNGTYAAMVFTGENEAWKDHVWDKKGDRGPIALWEVTTPYNQNAGADVWAAMQGFVNDEQEIVGAHFINNHGTKLFEKVNIEDGYMYYSWAAEDGKVYLVVLDVKGENVTVDIPLKAADGGDMGAYTAKFIAGRANASDITGNGNMNITLSGAEALLFEITSN